MTKNYYDILGVDSTADVMMLKRAYYTLVKQFPPERFPEQYKELRTAYDTLSDGEKRRKYDREAALPPLVSPLMEQAKNLERLGRRDDAAKLCRQILEDYPDLAPVMEMLATLYDNLGNTGKSCAIWQKLSGMEPSYAKYAFKLAESYDCRNWNKKALTEYRRAIELDSGEPEYWEGLVSFFLRQHDPGAAQLTGVEAIGALKEQGRESIQLAVYVGVFAMKDEPEQAALHLQDIRRLLQSGVTTREKPEEMVEALLDAAMRSGRYELLDIIRDLASLVPDTDGELADLLEQARFVTEVENLEEDGYDVVFHDLFANIFEESDCDEDKSELLAMEMHILINLDALRSQLLRLKAEKPRLYKMHASFFSEVLRTRDKERLIYQRVKALKKLGCLPEYFSSEEEDLSPAEPLRRIGPKIGRNAPCPCGSGKKYKNCCGG